MRNLVVRCGWRAVWVAVFLLWALPLLSAEKAPEYMPTCQNPQDMAPMQAAGGQEIYYRSAVVWNGKDYAVTWVDDVDKRLHFRRFFADGTPAGPIVTPSALQGFSSSSPSLVWTGTEYGVAWGVYSGAMDYDLIYFARLSVAGSLIGAEVQASFIGGLPGSFFACYSPSLAWSGSGYAVVWYDWRNPTYDIFGTLLNADGTIANAGASHDLVVCDEATAHQRNPDIAWSTASGRYVVAWDDYRSVTRYEIYGATITPSGVVSVSVLMVSGAGDSLLPALADTGSGLGLVWEDSRDGGNTEIYFARLAATGSKLGTDLRLTSDPAGSYYPQIVWTGAEFGVFWQDLRSGNYETWFQRVSAGGGLPGGILDNRQVTASTDSWLPVAAFARYGYLATCADDGYANYVQAWGCATDTTPPTCPAAPAEVSRTTSPSQTVTLAWGPSQDYETDVARYVITRNGTQVGTTADLTWTDAAFDARGGYVYWIDAVNAAGLTSGGCASVDTSDHVPPTCPGNLLATSVTSSQVSLIWLPSSDAKSGLEYYDIYRNGALLGQATTPTRWYNDVTVSPNTTYNYAVTAVDWAWNESAACQSLWVSTKPITLMMTKNPDGINANLDWTNVDLNEYVVYRSPAANTSTELKRVPLNATTDTVLNDGVRVWYYYIQQREP